MKNTMKFDEDIGLAVFGVVSTALLIMFCCGVAGLLVATVLQEVGFSVDARTWSGMFALCAGTMTLIYAAVVFWRSFHSIGISDPMGFRTVTRSAEDDFNKEQIVTENWELALIAVIDRELGQLEWLIKSEQNGQEDIEKADIHTQISRLGGLTDLSHPDGLPLSETSAARLRQQNEVVMRLARSIKT